jgi:hypothetical protein
LWQVLYFYFQYFWHNDNSQFFIRIWVILSAGKFWRENFGGKILAGNECQFFYLESTEVQRSHPRQDRQEEDVHLVRAQKSSGFFRAAESDRTPSTTSQTASSTASPS